MMRVINCWLHSNIFRDWTAHYEYQAHGLLCVYTPLQFGIFQPYLIFEELLLFAVILHNVRSFSIFKNVRFDNFNVIGICWLKYWVINSGETVLCTEFYNNQLLYLANLVGSFYLNKTIFLKFCCFCQFYNLSCYKLWRICFWYLYFGKSWL